MSKLTNHHGLSISLVGFLHICSQRHWGSTR